MGSENLTAAQFKVLESCIKHNNATFHLSGQSAWGGWGGTRAALQRRGYLDAGCKITEAGRAAYSLKTGLWANG